jgi:hypothetical protein
MVVPFLRYKKYTKHSRIFYYESNRLDNWLYKSVRQGPRVPETGTTELLEIHS